MRSSFFAFLTLVLCSVPSAWSNELPWDTSPSTAWPASSGQARIELRGDYLKDFGVDVLLAEQTRHERLQTPIRVGEGRLWAYVPYGNFEAFNGGELAVSTDLVLRHGSRSVDFRNFTLIPAEENRSAQLQLLDPQGNHLATISHIHALVQPERGELALHNADLQASAWLARALDLPVLEGMPLGQMWLDLSMEVPAGANLSRTSPDRGAVSCTGRPFWPQDSASRPDPETTPEYEVDVALIQIGTVAYQGRQGVDGPIKVAPSATLKSVGYGDAAWIPKFQTRTFYDIPGYPRDQHPFLVWNMYRIADGRIEQLGASGVKHAFLTLNFNCTINCGSSNVLWPGCEDVYSSGTNDSNSNQGPREDIIASEGLFYSVGSFFDPGATGSQTNNASSYENRLMIDDNELSTPGADYYLDAWYVVMDDIDIWNSMGYHSINPQPSGTGWSFGPLGPFTQGTPIENWVSKSTVDPMEGHALVIIDGPTPAASYPDNMPSGHVRVLARVTDLGGGQYRYNYAVMNFDFEHGLSEFVIPVPPGASVSETFMGGPADVLASEWPVSLEAEAVRFTAPSGDKLPWFTLYNFEIVVDQAPAVDGAVVLGPAIGAGPRSAHLPSEIVVDMVAPAAAPAGAIIFRDRFEAP